MRCVRRSASSTSLYAAGSSTCALAKDSGARPAAAVISPARRRQTVLRHARQSGISARGRNHRRDGVCLTVDAIWTTRGPAADTAFVLQQWVRQWRRTTRSATGGLQSTRTASDSTAPPTAAVTTDRTNNLSESCNRGISALVRPLPPVVLVLPRGTTAGCGCSDDNSR